MFSESEIVSVRRQAGGWVWAILADDPITRITRVVRQSRAALQTYEAAYDDARAALEEWRRNSTDG